VEARVEHLARAYAGLASPAGRAAAARQLAAYEKALPVRGAEVSPEQTLRNRVVIRLLAAAREAVKSA
jgi:hypothetical protein